LCLFMFIFHVVCNMFGTMLMFSMFNYLCLCAICGTYLIHLVWTTTMVKESKHCNIKLNYIYDILRYFNKLWYVMCSIPKILQGKKQKQKQKKNKLLCWESSIFEVVSRGNWMFLLTVLLIRIPWCYTHLPIIL